jgi:phenylalanyl-tRNA synthetase beta chain
MRVSYNWLRELCPGLDLPPARVAECLTSIGLEIESVEEIGAGLEALLVVEVQTIEPHPERERLRLVTVNRGTDSQRVVCGAANVPDPGGKLVLAPLGSTVPSIGELTARKIGGIVSEGMLCSETELGLAETSDGILILDSGAKPGTPFIEAYPEARDTVFEIGVTPNRPDALGHVGIARDLAARLGLAFQIAKVPEMRATADEKLSALFAVDNQSKERCPHYGAAAVLDVCIAPSPAWLRWRLQALGIRPISNVVDVTNLLLLEYGQPLHAFDLDLLRGKQIVIRQAKAGEAFATLDGVERKLDSDDLVICDGGGPVALAGVMGGANTEIRDTTTRVLLECAYFMPTGVRRSARRHGMHTESSHRFERGTDHGGVSHVLERAAQYLTELGSGKRVPGSIHEKGADITLPQIEFRSARLDALLGVSVPFDEALEALERLGLQVKSRDAARAVIQGASHRPDIAIEADLIEEVARIRGLDTIPTVLPKIAPQAPRPTGRVERAARRAAASVGLSEAITYSFVAPKDLERIRAPKAVVELEYPLSEERSVRLQILWPGPYLMHSFSFVKNLIVYSVIYDHPRVQIRHPLFF